MTSITPQFLAQKTWDLYQTHGVPIEVSKDIIEKHGLTLDNVELNKLIQDHQKLSQNTSGAQFKSGLGEDTEKTRKLHTTTHILHKVLRDLYGNSVHQTGSAITAEKARFDFSLDKKLDESDLEKITQDVQNIINLNLDMVKNETTEKEAREMGAIGLFGEKYGENVSVYKLVDKDGKIYSLEFCGGPHIKQSKEIGIFKIIKQKSVGQGLRRLEFDVF